MWFRTGTTFIDDPLSGIGASEGIVPQIDHQPRPVRPPIPVGKLLTDKLLAFAALCLLFPLLLSIAVCIRLTCGGPALVTQVRLGRSGRAFRALSFRTRRSDGSSSRLLRFLRKTRLASFPRFWNVLRGDMSLVGPRPLAASEVDKFGKHLAAYLSVRPGMTGLWQVNSKADDRYEARVAMDVDYINGWSMAADYAILKRALAQFFLGFR